ncbi:hypothetical protein WAI453_009431 [Rhynchosporium graminicola]|uniref:Uncharacterized protein n=1 Tax=Rhynchosporium graminicola TaxID=2792576 RepID=A0A1E1KSD1_9HELO|nr:uncharacterized protein RCO7_02866 [Rhynchosporium commune]
MAQSSSGAPDSSSISNIAPSPAASQPAAISNAQNQFLTSSALTRTSSCVEYDRLVGKIMRENFWNLEPFTVGLNPRLFDFHKEYIRSKAPHIKAKSRLLRRVLARMAEDEHLYLASSNPVLYITHPNRSTVDYLVMGDDPPWIAHFFNGSQAYPHIEEAMSRITHFLDSGRRFQPPTRLPTVGVSRASGFAISRLKTEELPSVEEYIDFVHFIVQSGSSPGSSGIIREDHFFPSLAVLPDAEVRKRANLIRRLTSRMVEDGVLSRVSAEDGTYVLHRDCRPSDYTEDRGLTDSSHWVWTFKKWAALDSVAEKAVENLDKFLMEISPAESAIVKIEPENEDESPSSKLKPVSRIKQDDEVYIVKQELTAPSSIRSRAPKTARPKHKPNDHNVSSSSRSESSGSDQSSIVPILTRRKSPSIIEISSSPDPELEPEDSLMTSIEDIDERSPIAIQRREEKSYVDYFGDTAEDRRYIFPSKAHMEFDALHAKYKNDSFEVIIKKTLRGYMFQIVCHDCNGRLVAAKYDGSLSKLKLHLDAKQHVSNVQSKVKKTKGTRVGKQHTQQRFKALKQASEQRDVDNNMHGPRSPFLPPQPDTDPPIDRNPQVSPSAQDMESLRSLWGLPKKAFNYKSPHEKVATPHPSNHDSSPPTMAGPSRSRPTPQLNAQDSLEELRKETTERLENLISANKRRKINLDQKLSHYDTLLGETGTRCGGLEEKLATLGSRHDQHEAEFENLAGILATGLETLLQTTSQRQEIPDEATEQLEALTEQLEALLTRDEQHEVRWSEQEQTRIKFSAAIEDLGQGQKALESRIGSVEARQYPSRATKEVAINARIKDLESSKTQLLESQKQLEQDNTVMNARFVLLEQTDESLDEAASLLTGIATRVENLEMVRNEALEIDHSFKESQKTLTDRINALEQQISTPSSSTSMVPAGPISEMIALLRERCTAQDEHINRLNKASKKVTKWIDYYEKLSTAQKSHLLLLESKQADEAAARVEFEERMEESLDASRVREENMADRLEQLLKDSKDREDMMIARIKKLEQREEHVSGQLALLKTYAPRSVAGSVVGSDNENAAPITPRSRTGAILPPIAQPFLGSSQARASSNTPRQSSQSSGRVTKEIHTGPILPWSVAPSQIGAGASTPTPSKRVIGSTSKTSFITPILPPPRHPFRSTSMGSFQSSADVTSPRSASPQPSRNATKSPQKEDTPKSSPLKNRKPRKF